MQREKIYQEKGEPLPAIVVFQSSIDERVSYDFSLEWNIFKLFLHDWHDGFFVLSYQIWSHDPETKSSGELRIHIQHP